MGDTLEMINSAQKEMNDINSELELQTDKFLNLQKKLGHRRSFLYDNDSAMKDLRKALKIKKFLILIGIIMIIFTISILLINYKMKY